MGVLLQFPTEAFHFRAERQEALGIFRTRCRLPVIRQYGYAAQDLGMYTANCATCGDLTARLHALIDLDPDLDICGLEAELCSRALDPSSGWVPAHCPACGADSPQPISAIFARYLPEVGLDLQIHLIRGGHRITNVDYWVMNMAGEVRAVENPTDSIDFADKLGIPLSLRAMWGCLVARHMYEPDIALYPIQPGYYLGIRPFAETDSVLARMAEPFYEWMEKQHTEGLCDVVAYFRDREDEGLDIPLTESYHTWLAGYASDVERALVDPFIVADSNAFVAVIDQLASLYGLTAHRVSGEDTLFIHLGLDKLQVRVNIGPLLFRTLHEGLTFHAGIKRHFMDEIRAVAASAELLKLLKQAFPKHRFNLLNGQYLQVLDPLGQELALVDAIRAGTSYDPRDDEEFNALCDELIPGSRPLALTLGRPLAGHLAPVIPRKIA